MDEERELKNMNKSGTETFPRYLPEDKNCYKQSDCRSAKLNAISDAGYQEKDHFTCSFL